MTTDEKLAAILAAVQTDPGNRGLARDPEDNLFTATKGDFQRACARVSKSGRASIRTGFYIPSASHFETDGPLGAFFIERALAKCGILVITTCTEPPLRDALRAARSIFNITIEFTHTREVCIPEIWIERTGPANDGKYYTMRGNDTSSFIHPEIPKRNDSPFSGPTIGIGDGGNEIGMGKIPHETIVKNIPNGDLIHCRVPTDHLIVAGVSNWGAYALAAGIFVLKGITPPDDLFDPDREREILEVMVKAGPLVDGVTGRQEGTVDGLTWEEYVKPLVRIRDILAS